MRSHARVTMLFATLLFALTAMALAAARAHAQGVLQLQRPTPQQGTVVSGNDFGFRITGARGGHVVGSLVVRQNGEWVEADLGSSVRQLTLR